MNEGREILEERSLETELHTAQAYLYENVSCQVMIDRSVCWIAIIVRDIRSCLRRCARETKLNALAGACCWYIAMIVLHVVLRHTTAAHDNVMAGSHGGSPCQIA
jgi:hypothetical protein